MPGFVENNTGMIQMWGSFSRSDFCASVSRFACAFTISIFKTQDPRGGAGRGPRGVRYYRKTDGLAYGDGVERAVQRRESSGTQAFHSSARQLRKPSRQVG